MKPRLSRARPEQIRNTAVEQFDYIVVGAGSAGSVLAHDLCADGRNRVLVLENGPTDRHPFVKIPLGYGLLFNDPARNYRYHTQPEPCLNGRRLYYPRGKTVGGSGSINALVYVRGLPSDFNSWAENGLTGWSWDDVHPIFDSLERSSGGNDGMVISNTAALRHRFTRHFQDAAGQLGWANNVDFNGPEPEGAGYYQLTTQNGFRRSSADAFLRPAIATGRAKLVTCAACHQILFKDGRAIGVSYRHRGSEILAHARYAVIITAGSINTPQLLQLSGIGDGEALRDLGVDVKHHNPNVGQHLQDHLGIGYYYEASEKTLNSELHSLAAKAWQTLRFLTFRRGPLAGSVNQFGAFLRSDCNLPVPDQQLYLNPATYTESRHKKGLVVQPDPYPGYTLSFQPTRPTSRGKVRAMSPDVDDAPAISLNALSTEKDRADVVAGARLIARLVQTPALARVTKQAISPCPTKMRDEDIIQDFRDRSGTVFHPCGSCAAGVDPAMSVVDPTLAVHGVEGLFIADASVFPSITSGNINATTLMVARKAAKHILRKQSGGHS